MEECSASSFGNFTAFTNTISLTLIFFKPKEADGVQTLCLYIKNIEIKCQQHKRRIYDLVKQCPKISIFMKHFLPVDNRRMNKHFDTATTYNIIAKLT